MADDQFQGREAAFPANIAGTLSAFTMSVVDSEFNMKRRHAELSLNWLSQQNVELSQSGRMNGASMENQMSLPAVFLLHLDSLMPVRASLEMHMDVSAHREDNLSVDSQTEISVSGGIPLCKGSFKTSLGVSYDRKRSSDYSSSTAIKMEFERVPSPELLMKVLDMMGENFRTLQGSAEAAPEAERHVA